ncbi:MAG: hypothetical protein N2322_07015, partial [Terrimicrobiaceae bacterium]|nr:hypothetical protein [Terrimicrobiaceae bacterium]
PGVEKSRERPEESHCAARAGDAHGSSQPRDLARRFGRRVSAAASGKAPQLFAQALMGEILTPIQK